MTPGRTSTASMHLFQKEQGMDLHLAHYLPRFPWIFGMLIINVFTVENRLHALAEDVKERLAIPARQSTAANTVKLETGNSTKLLAKSFGLKESFSGQQSS